MSFVSARRRRSAIHLFVLGVSFVPASSDQRFSAPTAWDIVSVTSASGSFGKALTLRMSVESVADVLVQRDASLHFLLEPGGQKQSSLVPITGTLLDFVKAQDFGYPDAAVVATSTGVSFWRYSSGAFVQEPLSTPALVTRLAVGPTPNTSAYAALVLWAPSTSKLYPYVMQWNPMTAATMVIPLPALTYDKDVQALELVDFDDDVLPDIVATHADGLDVVNFAGTKLKTIVRSGQTIGLDSFRNPETQGVDALAWLQQSSTGALLEAVRLGASEAPVALTGAYVSATTSTGGGGFGPSVVLSRTGCKIDLMPIGNPPHPIFTLASLQQAVDPTTTCSCAGWALLHDFDRESCDDVEDLLTFPDADGRAELHRGLPPGTELPVPVLSLTGNDPWDELYGPGFDPEQPLPFWLHVNVLQTQQVSWLRARVWAWPDLDEFAMNPVPLTDETFPSAEAVSLDLTLAAHARPECLMLEIRALDANLATSKILFAGLPMTTTPNWPELPEEACHEKVGGDSRGAQPLPGRPNHVQTP